MTTDIIVEKQKRTSKINTWKPTKDQVIVEKNGKLFECHFSKLFGHSSKLYNCRNFFIGKESYINQLDVITSYINFFINNYDFDNELVSAYLKIKFAVDIQKIYDESNISSYIDFIYEVMFTDTMVQKIIAMVEENYLDDIEMNTEEKKKYLKNEKKHLESLEFTNQHIKILLQISFGMKIMCAPLFHFTQLNHIKIDKDSDIIFRFYKGLFDLFGYGDTYELCRKNGEIINEGLAEDEVMSIVKEQGIEPVYDGKDTYYYFIGDDGEEWYYTRSKIDIYNKLYVYVNCLCIQTYVIS